MRKVLLVLTLAAMASGVPTLPGHGEEPKKPPKDDGKITALMRKKLQHSQKVLEGIALNDFKEISQNAEELIDISKQAEWRVIKTPQYELYSNEFRRTADAMVKNAKDRNLDGAALNYVDLTLSCVKCHKYVREVRMTRLDVER
ncbi:MAG TPA: hypothetical protein VFA26_18505 [Gemmataceae bacterium]|nr:hypothetical protein [Gemmataceae bacterium]